MSKWDNWAGGTDLPSLPIKLSLKIFCWGFEMNKINCAGRHWSKEVGVPPNFVSWSLPVKMEGDFTWFFPFLFMRIFHLAKDDSEAHKVLLREVGMLWSLTPFSKGFSIRFRVVILNINSYVLFSVFIVHFTHGWFTYRHRWQHFCFSGLYNWRWKSEHRTASITGWLHLIFPKELRF